MCEATEYLTITEVAAALRVNRKTIAGMIGRGELPAVPVGRHWRIPAAAMPGQPAPAALDDDQDDDAAGPARVPLLAGE